MRGAFGVARAPMMETALLPAAQNSRTRRGSFWTIVSVMILVGAEVFGVALAAGWAIAGLFEGGASRLIRTWMAPKSHLVPVSAQRRPPIGSTRVARRQSKIMT